MLRGYRELKVWQKSMDLVEESYRLTAAFPKHELYGLTSQLRRAAVSVAANIAEGLRKDFSSAPPRSDGCWQALYGLSNDAPTLTPGT